MTESSVVSRIVHDSYLEAPSLVSGRSWWTQLDPGFARQREEFELAFTDRMTVGAVSTLDCALRSVAASGVAALALPPGFNPLQLQRAWADRDFYGPIAESGDAAQFFKKPPSDVRVRVKKGTWFPRYEPEDGICEEIAFESPFEPVNPDQRKPYLRHRANRTAVARVLRHRDGPRPTIVAVHGFTADWYLINEWFFALPWFYRMGCDIVLFTLPFHGPRQTRFSPFSGHGYFAGGPSRMNEAVAQSVFDFRILMDWLQGEQGAPQTGVTGVSLGGFTAAIVAAAEDRLAFSIPNVPVISFADLVLEWQPIGALVNTALFTVRKSLVDVRYMLAASCPLTYKPALPPERLMIVGGIGDRLAPPKHSRVLWDHWGRCRIHWFPGSHIVHLDRGAYLIQMARFMEELGFLPEGARRSSG